VDQPRIVWRKPLWQRIVIAVVAIGLDVGMIALIASGSAGAWQPWFFLLVFTMGLAGWWLPRTVLDDASVTSRSAIGRTRTVRLDAVTGVGYGPLGVWIEAAAPGSNGTGEPTMILHAVQGVRPFGGVATGQQSGPSGPDAAAVISARAAAAGASVGAPPVQPSAPPKVGSLWSRLR
jgi:hypothetical protein